MIPFFLAWGFSFVSSRINPRSTTMPRFLMLEHAIKGERYESRLAVDFALFGSAQEAFLALYSVGFVGLRDATSDHYHFCHDGASANLLSIEPQRTVAIHPCYWRALNADAEVGEDSIVIQADDEVEVAGIIP